LRLAGALSVIAALALSAASAARAADRIYWSNDFGHSISWANLDGSGGGGLNTSGAFIHGPMGLAIDSAAGRIYWANWGNVIEDPGQPDNNHGTGTTISWANLDGSGGDTLPLNTVSGPHGLAIDPVAGKIYWTNVNDNTIDYANLNGSGETALNTTNATVSQPRGLAIDPVTRRIYWANWQDGTGTTISYADLDGSGGGDLMTDGATVDGPEGVALDLGAGRIYWGNFTDDPIGQRIAYASLNGSGSPNDLDTTGATVDNAHGVAIDPIAGKIYWPNFYANVISWANLDGSGGGDLMTDGATLDAPNLPVLLETPEGTGAPVVSGGTRPGSTLSCTQGSWAPDLIASLLYRAPERFEYRWSRNGEDIAGATSGSYSADVPGDYRCRVIGSNPAGSASQTSDPQAVLPDPTAAPPSNAFSFGRLKLDRKRGTATLVVSVPEPGTLVLTGQRVVRQRADAAQAADSAGKVNLLVESKGKARRKLRTTGEVKVEVSVTFTPTGGNQTVKSRGATLEEKIRR
jgi:DNA-binding beta-propeller fold protein YncE